MSLVSVLICCLLGSGSGSGSGEGGAISTLGMKTWAGGVRGGGVGSDRDSGSEDSGLGGGVGDFGISNNGRTTRGGGITNESVENISDH